MSSTGRWPCTLAVAALLLGAAACTGGDATPAPSTTPSTTTRSASTGTASGTPSEAAVAASELTDRVFGQASAAPAVASVTGPFPREGWPATVEVVRVQASATATVLSWRLRSADGQSHQTGSFGVIPVGQNAGYTDVRDVRLLDPTTKQYSLPSLYVSELNKAGKRYCLCSSFPTTLTATGVELIGHYPALPAGVTQVDVAVPGFPVAKGVPVQRR